MNKDQLCMLYLGRRLSAGLFRRGGLEGYSPVLPEDSRRSIACVNNRLEDAIFPVETKSLLHY